MVKSSFQLFIALIFIDKSIFSFDHLSDLISLILKINVSVSFILLNAWKI